MKTTSLLPPSGELLRVPLRLAERLTIDGLTAAQTRLAIVLVSLAANDGSWTIAKPILQSMTGIVMNNALRILQPLEEAALVAPANSTSPARQVRLFEELSYVPGRMKRTAGMVTARLTDAARAMLSSGGAIVTIMADELRFYGSLGGIWLRLRLGARMSKLKVSKVDTWTLHADDMAYEFGVHAEKWVIDRKSKTTGDDKRYISLARAAHMFFEPGINEINHISLQLQAKLGAITLSDDPGSRWKAIVIETYQSSMIRISPQAAEPAPAAKPRMSELNHLRRDKLPAYAKKQLSAKV